VMPMISIACPVWLSVVPARLKPGRDSRLLRHDDLVSLSTGCDGGG